MNLSLKNRVAASFGIATIVVLILIFMVFHFLNSLNKEIEIITVKSNKTSISADQVRISAVMIMKRSRELLTKKNRAETIEKLTNLCDNMTSELQALDALYRDGEAKQIVKQMLSYVDSLKIVLSKSSVFNRDDPNLASIGDLADKILDAFSEFQDIQSEFNNERERKFKSIIEETKKNMMITLIIGFLGSIILALVVPGKIALPFKKIKDAIRELQDCNFDVSIYYSQDDEIGEIAREMNKMIQSFKVFEELRTDRIGLENRKFDVLANMVKRPVLIANANGELIYMNNQLYSLLQVQSVEVIGKQMVDTVMPKSIIETFEIAIKRRSKIENAQVAIEAKREEEKDIAEAIHSELDEDGKEVVAGEEEEEVVEYVYQGYANVIPIRGKDSSLDYYLMVLSKEVYV
ncbi:HAMP domain protein [Bacteriovorax sp. BSW11_IV]|uniref:HAMP domain-containing protein n=1 Tax=Bacteriovorax sp. BSW11_IV TaxID=1353529 RepID=UPI00038A0C3D|nr:HAMP domain-containing protein [Bacteriovorax sp. BSW11_IV]EQC45837.1 HAMP domain protein [Bacteriovorax sp. BSW11_IV]